MSDKLTDIVTVVTTPDPADLIYIVDVDDPTDDPAGTSAKITVDDLTKDKAPLVHTHVKADVTDFNVVAADVNSEASTVGQVLESDGAGNAAWATPAGGGGGITEAPIDGTPYSRQDAGWVAAAAGGGTTSEIFTKTLITEIDLTVAGEFDFTLPTGYDNMWIEGQVLSTSGITYDVGMLYFNEELVDANYRSQLNDGDAGTSGTPGAATPRIFSTSAGGSPANSITNLRIEIPRYEEVGYKKSALSSYTASYGAAALFNGNSFVESQITAAITRVRLRTDNNPTDQLTGNLKLYGERVEAVGGGTGGGTEATMLTLTPVETVDPIGGTLTFTVPATANTLVIKGITGSDEVNNQSVLRMFMNGDEVLTNYHRQRNAVNNGGNSITEDNSSEVGLISCAGSTSPTSEISIRIPDAQGSGLKGATGTYNIGSNINSTLWAGSSFTQHKTLTAPLTTIKLVCTGVNILHALTMYVEEEVTVGGGGTGGGTPTDIYTKEFIEEVTATAGSMTFTVPAGYDRLYLDGFIESNAASTNSAVNVYLNGDTTAANYLSHVVYGYNNGAGGSETADGAIPFISTIGAGQPSTVHLLIEDPNGAEAKRISYTADNYRTLGTELVTMTGSIMTDGMTAPVTSITIQGATATINGTMKLYGEKAVSVGGGAGGGATEVAIPNVKTAYYNGADGTLSWTNAPGEFVNATRVVAGQYEVPLPPGLTLGQFTVQCQTIDADTSETYASIRTLLATEMTIKCHRGDTASTLADKDFCVTITEDDTLVSVGGGTGGESITTTVKELLDDQVDPVAGQFDFTIPAGYDRIWLEAEINSDKATADDLYFEINGDTTQANYRVAPHAVFANGSHYVTQTQDTRIVFVPSDVQTGRLGYFTIDLRSYEDVGVRKTLSVHQNAMYESLAGVAGSTTVDSAITAAVTSLTLLSPANNLKGRVRLYGEKQASIGGGAGGTSMDISVPDLIQTIELAAEGEFDFTVPAGYDRLIVKGFIDAPGNAGTLPYAYCYLNENTTIANYHCGLHQVVNGSNSVTEFSNPSIAYIGGIPAITSAYIDLRMENPDSTDNKIYRVESGSEFASDQIVSSQFTLSCSELNPIVRLRFTNPTAFGLTGKLQLYGEKVVTVGGGTGGGAAGTTVKIETITNTVAGGFDFDSIPQIYSRVYIKGYVRSTDVLNYASLTTFLNADETVTNYHVQPFIWVNNALNYNEENNNRIAISSVPGAASVTGAHATILMEIEGYADAGVQKIYSTDIKGERTTGQVNGQLCIGSSVITDAITRIRIDGDGANDLTGKLTLYGEI